MTECIVRLVWDGKHVDAYPTDEYSVADMLSCNLAEPFDDIYEANDTSHFDEDEPLGYVRFDTKEEYELDVHAESPDEVRADQNS